LIFVQKCEPKRHRFRKALAAIVPAFDSGNRHRGSARVGRDVEQIAEMRNAKITTVRTQIAAMLLKTRTRRQGSLSLYFQDLYPALSILAPAKAAMGKGRN
jgi:hypothetical protein